MCNPVAGAAIMGGAALGEGLMGAEANSQQRKFEERRYKANITEFNKDSFDEYAALQARDVQETAAATESIKQAGVAAAQARAAVASGAATSGVAGNTVQALVDEVSAGEAEYVSGIIQNRVWGQSQLERQAKAIRSETYQRIIGTLPRTPKTHPLSIFFNTVGAAGQGAAAGAAFK